MKIFSLPLLLALAPLALTASLAAQTTVTITATDAAAAETWPGQTPNSARVRVARTGSTTGALEVWIKVGGAATLNADYAFGTPVGASVTIPAGSAHLDIPVHALDDGEAELDEDIRVELEEETPDNLPVPYDIGASDRAEIDLFDNDSLPPPAIISVAAESSASEGSGGGPVAGVFRFSRSGNTSVAVTVAYSVEGSATSGADYAALSGSVLIPAGATFADVMVRPVDDAELEGDESVSITLLPSTCASQHPLPANCYAFGESVMAELNLEDNEIPPVRAVVEVAVIHDAAENSSGSPVVGTFRFTRSENLDVALTVAYLVGGTATPSADYAALSGTVAIPPGIASVDVIVTPVDDAVIELTTEFVTVTIRPPNCGERFPAAECYLAGESPSASLAVVSDDLPPVRAVVEVAAINNAAENSGGSTVAGKFRFTRSVNLDVALTVAYTVGGTATAPADYAALPGIVTIPPGVATVDVAVSPVDDTSVESDESVTVTITPSACPGEYPPAECYLVGASGSAGVMITSEDVPPVRAVVDVAAIGNGAENSGGSPVAGAFRFTRSVNPEVALTVTYTVGGTAASPADYAAMSGSVNIPAGVASVDVTVTPVDDSRVEPIESVTLTISPSTCPGEYPPAECYLVGASGSATVTITSDDVPPVVAVTVSQNTNFVGLPAVGQGSFTAHSTNGYIAAYQVRVDGAQQFYKVLDHITPPAPGTQFTANFAMTNLPAGNRTVQLTVWDNHWNSTVITNLLAIRNIPMPSVFQAVAIDADAAETLPGEPTNTGRIRFTMTGDMNLGIWDWGFGGTARINSDYTLTWDGGTLTTNGNILTWTMEALVAPIDDHFVETTETMDLQACFVIIAWIYGVGAPIGTECSSFGAVVNIRDNDTSSPYPVIRVAASDADAAEVSPLSGDAPNPGAFTISRSGPATNDLPVYFTIAGTAKNGTDYSTVSATMILPIGTSVGTLSINPVFDVLLEGNETVTLTLRPSGTNPVYLLDPGNINHASVVIRDYAPTNVPVIRIKVTDSMAFEQPSTSPHASFRLDRTGNREAAFAMPYTISGTAINGRDYVALPGVASFVAGSSFTTITITPYIDGETNEPDETVVLTLTPPHADVFPPPYMLGGPGTLVASAGATIREDAPPRRPLSQMDRFERARRLRFPGRYRIVPLPILPLPTLPESEPAPVAPLKTWAVEASSDFATWQEIGTTEDPEEFLDVDAGDAPQRFYRFRELPTTQP